MKQIYKIRLDSNDKDASVSPKNSDCYFHINLRNAKIKRGMIFLDTLFIKNGGQLWNDVVENPPGAGDPSLGSVRLVSRNLQNFWSYDSKNQNTSAAICEIPLEWNSTILNDSNFFYKNTSLAMNSIGYPIQNLSLDGLMLHIKLETASKTELENSAIERWIANLIIIDYEHSKLE